MGKTYSVATKGLWARRKDLRSILDADVQYRPFALNHVTDGYLGWGDKPSSAKAKVLAEKLNTDFIRLEDGFLKGWSAGSDTPSAAYVVDPVGIYYDAQHTSLLEKQILSRSADPDFDFNKNSSCIQEIIRSRLSKYNDAPIVELKALGVGKRKFVLLVDQVDGDQSISGSGASTSSFLDMLNLAIAEHPDCDIVIKAHPAASREGPLLKAARTVSQQGSKAHFIVIKDKVNLWPLIENCVHFYTVSSQTGFEALLAGKPVTCFGLPFYAGWGLTKDKLKSWRNSHKVSIGTIFHAAYIDYSRYLSMHTRESSTLENVIDELTWLTKSRRRNGSKYITVDLSYRKHQALTPLLMGTSDNPNAVKDVIAAVECMKTNPEAKIAVWGQDNLMEEQARGLPILRIEDGFIRSVGLGAAFARPYSVVVDPSGHLHFDRRGESELERLLNNVKVSPQQIDRALAFAERIKRERVNKYMLSGRSGHLPKTEGKTHILVPGQVEGDASLRYGSPEINSNTKLINRVRELFPDAIIAFKEHPDVSTGLRPGKADTSAADLVVTGFNIADLLEWCDRVETMTSLTGFEALIYGKPVGTHGYPFYAGWGFTTDRISEKYRRARKKLGSFEELLYVTMFEYPLYIHPQSELHCSPEALLDALTTFRPNVKTKLKTSLLTALGQIRHKTRSFASAAR